jgi:hypothetical protein
VPITQLGETLLPTAEDVLARKKTLSRGCALRLRLFGGLGGLFHTCARTPSQVRLGLGYHALESTSTCVPAEYGARWIANPMRIFAMAANINQRLSR